MGIDLSDVQPIGFVPLHLSLSGEATVVNNSQKLKKIMFGIVFALLSKAKPKVHVKGGMIFQ
jgi:hypothetical protein